MYLKPLNASSNSEKHQERLIEKKALNPEEELKEAPVPDPTPAVVTSNFGHMRRSNLDRKALTLSAKNDNNVNANSQSQLFFENIIKERSRSALNQVGDIRRNNFGLRQQRARLTLVNP